MRLPLVCLAVIGCTSSSHPLPAADLQMNDLSVLLPLATSQAELDASLGMSTPAGSGQLFPQAVYQMGSSGFDYASLHAVAFRFDPCFGQLGAITDDGACKNQLRVVFQPMVFDTTTNQAIAQDAAVHAFYSLTREQLLDAVNEIAAARKADAGDRDLGPLAVHPMIAHEGRSGTLGKAFDQVITKYASEANLVRFTEFEIEFVENGGSGIVGSGEFWQFFSFLVDHGTVSPNPIPTLSQSQNGMSLEATTNPLDASGSPATTSSDNLAMLESFMQASQATAADREHAFGAALRVLNPQDNSPDTIDCASCHLAHPAVELVGEQLGMTPTASAGAFVPSAAIPAIDLSETTSLVGSDGVLNIHAFSYRNQDPMINQRVINETAANLVYVGSLLQ